MCSREQGGEGERSSCTGLYDADNLIPFSDLQTMYMLVDSLSKTMHVCIQNIHAVHGDCGRDLNHNSLYMCAHKHLCTTVRTRVRYAQHD